MQAAEKAPHLASSVCQRMASLVQLSAWEDGKEAAQLALDCDNADMHARINLRALSVGMW